ncbi:MAG: lysylphosphatidylglycerol synthase transmembrane domain-containing protein [Desulfobacterales bacterium]
MRDAFDTVWVRKPWLRHLLATVLLALLIWKVPAGKIWSILKTTDPAPIGAAVAMILVARVLGAWRTKMLSDHQGLSFSLPRIFEIGCTSTLYGMALPGSFSGGIVRWYRLSQPEHKRSEAFAVLSAERVVDFMVLALFGYSCLIAETIVVQLPLVAWGLAGVAVTCLLALLVVFSEFGTTLDRLLHLDTPKAILRLPQVVLRISRRVVSDLLQFRNVGAGKLLVLLMVSLLLHIVATIAQYQMAVSLGLDLTLVSIGWLRACTVLLTTVPLTPSGLGIREFSLVFLLLPFGVTAHEAVAFSLLQFGGMLLVVVLGAFLEARRFLSVRPD